VSAGLDVLREATTEIRQRSTIIGGEMFHGKFYGEAVTIL
jgi:hypothetical protein